MHQLTATGAPQRVLAAGIDSEGRSWIQVMKTAEKARNGKWFFTITADDLEVYAQSIRDNAERISVDRDHRTDEPDTHDTRAAGWFTGQAQVLAEGAPRPDGSSDVAAGPELWAEVRWTPTAAQEIRDGDFRFISPVWSHQEKDAKTGLLTKAKDFIRATLTNRPFFDMAPVMASVVWTAEEGFNHLQEAVNRALNPGPGEYRYWVMDVAPGKALVRESGGGCRTWVVPFTMEGEDAQLAPQSDWTEAEQEWVEAAEDFSERAVMGAVWSAKYVNSLPDSAFLHVESGKKDSEGKTTPRRLRHFPVKDANGAIDLPHLRNALSRIPQSNLADDVKQRCMSRARRLLSAQNKSGAAARDTKEAKMADSTVSAVLGLAEDADEEKVVEAASALKTERDELKTEVESLKAAKTENESLKAKVETIEAERLAEKKDALIAQAVRDGKADPVEKETLAKLDLDVLSELVEKRPARQLKAVGSDSTSSEGDGDADAQSVRKQHTITVEGREIEPDQEGVDLQVKAQKWLADRKIDHPTEQQLLEAYEAVRAAA